MKIPKVIIKFAEQIKLNHMETLLAIIFVIFGILQIILFFKIWGMTNDVREIKNMYQIKRGDHQINSVNTASNRNSETRFKKGDLVIILKNENQFRITDIIEENGIIYYTSNKIKEKYSDNDLEYFDLYWNKKKSRNQ